MNLTNCGCCDISANYLSSSTFSLFFLTGALACCLTNHAGDDDKGDRKDS
ncbi:hypothetical protein QUA81_19610 [Microcoleus sp. F6_B4]